MISEKTKEKILIIFIVLCWVAIIAVLLNSSNLDCDKCTVKFGSSQGDDFIENVTELKQKFDEGICIIEFDKIMGVKKNYGFYEN